MQKLDISSWLHEHIFLGERQQRNERRTLIVIALTATMMVVEIAAGILFGSMALLADGWHMASHAAALGLTALGYTMARRHATNPSFSFGTGKIGELAGYTSALLLAVIAIIMAYESLKRLYAPVQISFGEAIGVAVVGLIVNLVSAFILNDAHDEHHHDHDHEHDHDHHRHADHNLRAAYLHVLADALTSVMAIAALTAGLFLGWVWMDPLMGIVGAIVISRWAFGLLRDTGRILLDMNLNGAGSEDIKKAIEADTSNRVADLHVWRVGPGHSAAIVSVVTDDPRPPHHYKDLLHNLQGLSHVTVEVNPYQDCPPGDLNGKKEGKG